MSLTVDGARHMLSLFANMDSPLEALWFTVSTENIGINASGYDIYEPPAAEYERVMLSNTSGSWELLGTSLSNSEEITFPVATEDWGLITSWAACDTNEGGVIFMTDVLETPVFVEAGQQITIPAGGISLDLDIDKWAL